tara:strand:- start:94 stop:468 length:375 start_codon:yes stop_codon:yes gene_type:complete
MSIPIFNTLYRENNTIIKSNILNIKILNNLELENIDLKRFPIIKIIDKLIDNDSLFETVIVSANDILVNRFLNNQIKFNDISKILLKIANLNEFKKFKRIKPQSIDEIDKLVDYVSFKIKTMSV